jgi:hypothetical protein
VYRKYGGEILIIHRFSPSFGIASFLLVVIVVRSAYRGHAPLMTYQARNSSVQGIRMLCTLPDEFPAMPK